MGRRTQGCSVELVGAEYGIYRNGELIGWVICRHGKPWDAKANMSGEERTDFRSRAAAIRWLRAVSP